MTTTIGRSSESEGVQPTTIEIPTRSHKLTDVPVASTSGITLSPEDIRPFKKAEPRQTNGGRKPVRARNLIHRPQQN